MGANGNITIWNDAEVRNVFVNCDEMFLKLPTYYSDTLDGIVYHHCYEDDNQFCSWFHEPDWYSVSDDQKNDMRVFVQWLLDHGTTWEVWT